MNMCVNKKSELLLLLEKSAYGEGLSPEEESAAFQLIRKPVQVEGLCWMCGSAKHSPAIYDTGLCKGHALFALVSTR